MGTELEFRMTRIIAEGKLLRENLKEYQEVVKSMEEDGMPQAAINKVNLLIQKTHGKISDLMEEAENLQVAIWNEESAAIQRHEDKIHVRGW